jgi:hypothetical protein
MRCDACEHWTIARTTVYDDGSKVDTFRAEEGKGFCCVLKMQTASDFGCNKFAEIIHANLPGIINHIILDEKAGAPWQHWAMGPCPDCHGKGNAGDGGCYRCTGTGNVRFYDDGFVGDERTRRHPKEPLTKARDCPGCRRPTDHSWVACPHCGQRLVEPPADTETPEEGQAPGGQPGGFNGRYPTTEPRKVFWRDVFGITVDWKGTLDELGFLYRTQAKICHPEAGGSNEKMTELNLAYEEGKRELRPST